MLYKVTIKPYSSFKSNLQSDTLFGAFCWTYKYINGENALENFLEKCVKDKPQIIFSNAFLKDTLPLPIGVIDELFSYDEKDCFEEKIKKHNSFKKFKTAKLIKKDCFFEIQQKNYKNLLDNIVFDDILNQNQIHNLVNRMSNTVTNIDNNPSLFVSNEYFTKNCFDFYILTDLDTKTLEKLLSIMFTLGIGAKKSSGKGVFEILDICEEVALTKKVNNSNAFLALSNFIPKENDPTNGKYNIINKFSKLDREYSSTNMPFKKPLRMIEAGSYFYTNNINKYYGRCIDDVSLLSKNIIVNACTISVPIII